jgi:hypothetical protein
MIIPLILSSMDETGFASRYGSNSALIIDMLCWFNRGGHSESIGAISDAKKQHLHGSGYLALK